MCNAANFSRNRTPAFIVGRSLWSRERIGWQAKAPAPQERKPPRAKVSVHPAMSAIAGMLGKVCGISVVRPESFHYMSSVSSTTAKISRPSWDRPSPFVACHASPKRKRPDRRQKPIVCPTVTTQLGCGSAALRAGNLAYSRLSGGCSGAGERFRSPKSAGLKPAAARIGCPTNGAAQQ